jgi:hypothetical protein
MVFARFNAAIKSVTADPVAFVVVGASFELARSHRQTGLGAVDCLDADQLLSQLCVTP